MKLPSFGEWYGGFKNEHLEDYVTITVGHAQAYGDYCVRTCAELCRSMADAWSDCGNTERCAVAIESLLEELE